MIDFTPYLISVEGWASMWDSLFDGLSFVVEWLKTHYIYYRSQSGVVYEVSYFNIDVAFTIIAMAWLAVCNFMDNSPEDEKSEGDE